MTISTALSLALKRRGGTSDGSSFVADGNEKNELIVAQGLPPFVEASRKYGHWSAMNTSALAALVVRPTTVANFTLYNNELAGGKTYVMDRVFAFNLVSTAAQAKQGMWVCVHKPGLVSPTNDITARGSGVGAPTYGGRSVCDTAMTVIDDGWFPVGNWSDVEPTGVLPGAIMEYKFEGRVLVPPTCGISVQVVSSVTGNTFTAGFSWWEVSGITIE
jgi:hypothetical protein